jgi:hypothetical protein
MVCSERQNPGFHVVTYSDFTDEQAQGKVTETNATGLDKTNME